MGSVYVSFTVFENGALVLCSLSTRGDGVPVFIALIWDDLLNRGCEIWRRKTGNIRIPLSYGLKFFFDTLNRIGVTHSRACQTGRTDTATAKTVLHYTLRGHVAVAT